MSVVAPLELEDVLPLRDGTGQPGDAHRGLGAAAGEAHHLEMRHPLGNPISEFDLALGGHAEARAQLHHARHLLQDHVGGVPQDERAPRQHVVDVFVAVGIPHAGPLAARRHKRLAPDPAKGAHRRIDAAGKTPACPRHDLGGTRVVGEQRGRRRHRPKLPADVRSMPTSGKARVERTGVAIAGASAMRRSVAVKS